MAGLVKNWLQIVPWEAVVPSMLRFAKPARPCTNPRPTVMLRQKNYGNGTLSLPEVFQIGFQCHRLAPFCNYNGNTFVTIIKTLLDDVLKGLPADKAHILRSIAGHIVAGTATDIEQKQLDSLLAALK
jgi:hypothetical protein